MSGPNWTSPLCHDCNIVLMPQGSPDKWQWYMVTDDVWRKTGLAPNGGALCLRCIERRLGYTLCRTDFSDAWINHLTQNTPELRERMCRDYSEILSADTIMLEQSTTGTW